MRSTSLSLAGVILAALAATVATPTSACADDAHLNESTVFLISASDWKTMKTALEASDPGRFLADPEIRRIGENLKKGMSAIIQKGIEEASAGLPEGTDATEMKTMMDGFLKLGETYCTSLCEDMSGRVALSIGMWMDPAMPMPMPNLIVEYGGSDRLHEMNSELIAQIVKMSEGEAKKAEFTANGFAFSGVEDSGMGIYFGRKGDRFVAGINRAGLIDYLGACEAGTARLGAQPFYKSAMAATGGGHMSTFVHLTPVWQMAMGMLAGIPVSEGEPNPAALMQTLGFTDVQGMASTATWTPQGASNRTFLGVVGRKGLMRMIPTENKALTPPPFSPSDVLSATSFRIEISQLLNVVRDGLALAPPEQKAEFDQGLEQAKEMLGFSVDELFSDFEGTIFTASPAGAAPMNPMAMMMGGGAGLDLSFGLKLKSNERFKKLLGIMMAPEVSQGMLTKQEISGREVWSIMAPVGPAPMQFAVAFEGDWLIFSTGTEPLKKCFSRSDSGENLAGNAAYGSLVKRVGGDSGMMITYADTGKSLAQWADMIRPMIGMIPLFVPDVQQAPELMFFFDPGNLPSSTTLQKYFGPTVTRGRITDGGLLVDQWTPSKSAPKKEEKKGNTGL